MTKSRLCFKLTSIIEYKNYRTGFSRFVNFFSKSNRYFFHNYRAKKLLKLKIHFNHKYIFFKNSFYLFSFFLIPFGDKKTNFHRNYFENVQQIYLRLDFTGNIVIKKTYQNLKNIKLIGVEREENLEILDFFYGFLVFFWTLGILICFVNFFATRNAKKIYLPNEYDSEKIISYYKLKPEKIFFRISQIFTKIVRFFLILMLNRFIYYKKIVYSKKFENSLRKNRQELLMWQYASCFLKNKIIYKIKKKLITLRFENVSIISSVYTKRKNFSSEDHVYNYRAKQLSNIVSALSPAFVKLAQAFSSRPEIIGEKIAKQLQRLQHGMPFFPNEVAFSFIKKELGAHPDKIFSKISDFPVAAASLGQVYKAILNRIPVAIKIQRPKLIELLALDIILIRFLVFWIQKTLKIKTNLLIIVDEYATRLFEELDYREEASSMIKFKSLYGYMDRIYIPRVFLEYSGQHVLVTEWIEGNRIIKDSFKILHEDISLIEIGIRCSLVQLLEVGFLHCDPHGGNLIKTKKDELAYIDFGLVSEIPIPTRQSLLLSVLHSINREYELLAKDFTNLALIRNGNLDKDVLNLSLALSTVFGQTSVNLDEFTFRNTIERLFRLTFEYSFILPPYFLNNLRAIITLEGIALMVDPAFRITEVISSYTINRLLSNPFSQFSFTLENFLTNDALRFNWDRIQIILKNSGYDFFSNQCKNLSDNILNFLISFTENFLKKKILQILSTDVELWMAFFFLKNVKKITKFYPEKKTVCQESTDITNLYQTNLDELGLILLESKIYSVNFFFLTLRLFFLSSVMIFTGIFEKTVELLIREIN